MKVCVFPWPWGCVQLPGHSLWVPDTAGSSRTGPGTLLLQQELLGPLSMCLQGPVASVVLSHEGAPTDVLSVENELEWKDLGSCWIREIFALGKTQFLDNLIKLMHQGVKSISTGLVCWWLGGLPQS